MPKYPQSGAVQYTKPRETTPPQAALKGPNWINLRVMICINEKILMGLITQMLIMLLVVAL